MDTKIIHITAAQGPLECQLAVSKVLSLLLDSLRNLGGKCEVIDRKIGDANGTLHSATIEIKGKAAIVESENWIGTIQWIQKSPFRPMHGRKNWFIGVYEIPEINELKFKESDIDFQAVRSSGAGGQYVNKVSSAIRATHRATGISVFSQESRSQQQNKKIAIERLKVKIALENTEIQLKMIAQKWMQHKNLERGNAVKVFQN